MFVAMKSALDLDCPSDDMQKKFGREFQDINELVAACTQYLGISLDQIEKQAKEALQTNKSLSPLSQTQLRFSYTLPLPDHYLELNRLMCAKRCSCCNFYPATEEQELYICCLCSEVMCSRYCKKKKDQTCGNLVHHSDTNHFSKTAYLCLKDAIILLVFEDVIFEFGAMYYNKVGKAFTDLEFCQKNPNWHKYYLNKNMVKRFESIVNSNRIPTTVATHLG